MYKRQLERGAEDHAGSIVQSRKMRSGLQTVHDRHADVEQDHICLLYTSDAADERSSVDLGGRRIIKKKKKKYTSGSPQDYEHIAGSAPQRAYTHWRESAIL